MTNLQEQQQQTQQNLNQKIIIIGAGPSGIVALKEFIENGYKNIKCIDKHHDIGGLFQNTYDELYTTTTNMFLSFSDYTPITYYNDTKNNDNDGELKYWTSKEYLDYLNAYVDHFGIRDYIQLNTEVKECNLNEKNGKWKIITTTMNHRFDHNIDDDDDDDVDRNGKKSIFLSPFSRRKNNHQKNASLKPHNYESYDADYLIVATGTNQIPKYPTIPNCNIPMIHSAEFTNAERLCKDKRILVIGNGESAADVAAQSTDVAKKVTLWTRREFSMGPRFILKFLKEGIYDERQILHNQNQMKLQPNDTLEGISNNRVLSRLPLSIFSLALDAMLTDVTKMFGRQSPAGVSAEIMKRNFAQDFFALDTSAPTKSGGVIAHAVSCRGLDVIVCPTIKFKKDSNGTVASFENASFMGRDRDEREDVNLDVDLIIACTGYEVNYDWIKVDDINGCIEANPRKWFKHCFPPNLGHKVCFLGHARPAQGGIPQCSELLARYIALLLKNERSLPFDYADQAIKEGRSEEETFYATPHAQNLVEFAPFVNSIARLIGCEPQAPLNSLSRYIKFWTLPQWTCFYRLNGPGAKPDVCWNVVDKYRIVETLVPMPLLIVYILFGLLLQPLLMLEIMWMTIVDLTLPPSAVLPRLFHWRTGGHFYQLSGNMLRFIDLIMPSSGWLLIQVGILLGFELISLLSVSISIVLVLTFVFIIWMINNNNKTTNDGGHYETETLTGSSLVRDEKTKYDTIV